MSKTEFRSIVTYFRLDCTSTIAKSNMFVFSYLLFLLLLDQLKYNKKSTHTMHMNIKIIFKVISFDNYTHLINKH